MPFLRRLHLDVSAISAFCGRHRFRSRQDAFVNVLLRNPKAFERVQNVLDQEDAIARPLLCQLEAEVPPDKTPSMILRDLIVHKPDIRQLVATSLSRSPTTEEVSRARSSRPLVHQVLNRCATALRRTPAYLDVVSSTKVEEKDLGATHSEAKKILEQDQIQDPKVLKKLASLPACDRGRDLECSAQPQWEHLLRQEGLHVVDRQVAVGMDLTVGDTVVHVRGRVDILARRTEDDAMIVLEIKNRLRTFFSPSYDLDQLCVYLVASPPDRTMGYLLEQCQGRQRMGYLMTRSEAEERWIQDIVPRLRTAVKDFVKAVETPTDAPVWQGLTTSRIG